jgi:hypothetical protein
MAHEAKTMDGDLAQAEADMAQDDGDVPAAAEARIAEEVEAASAVVEALEADSRAKGIPLTLSGARYIIYTTLTGD